MIKVEDNGRIFRLSGKNYTYAFCVSELGYLRHLYYGAKLPESDSLYFMEALYPQSFSPIPYDAPRGFSLDAIGQEYSLYGRGDYRKNALIVEDRNGSPVFDLFYKSYRVTDGAVKLSGLPCARYGGQTLTVVLEDEIKKIRVELNYVVFEDSDVIVRNAEIINLGEKVTLRAAKSFSLDYRLADFTLLKLEGTPVFERNIELTKVAHGVQTVSSQRGVSSHALNPFIALLEQGADEHQGGVYGFNLIYSGSFETSVEKTPFNHVRVVGGINDVGFSWELKQGESFVTPQATLCYSEKGLGGLSREYHDFIRAHVIERPFATKTRPIVINNWEATYFDFDDEKIYRFIDCAKKAGIDTFVLDDGWFGIRNDDTSGLGDWVVNKTKLKDGLEGIIKHCKKNGLKFGLWFEPEMVSENSDLYRAHPEWAVRDPEILPCKSRNQLVLDFTNPEVVEHIYQSISAILEGHDISYVKWDMNRNLTDFYSPTLIGRQGEFQHRYMLGVYELCEKLRKRYPTILFEGCSGGGGRFDLGMLYYFPQIWASDDTDAYQRTKIEYGTSVAYPLSSISCHVSDVPNECTYRTTSMEARRNVARLGPYGYELDLTKFSDEELADIKQDVESYRKTSDLILNGDLYRLSSPFEGKTFFAAVVSKDKERALFVGLHGLKEPNFRNVKVKIRGLRDDYIYRISGLNLTLSGKALKSVGIELPVTKDFETWRWEIEKVTHTEEPRLS